MSQKPKQLIPEKVIGFQMDSTQSKITSRDGILYALGINYSQDPLNQDDLKYTYELNDDFKICPTFGTVCTNMNPFETLNNCQGFPDFNAMMLLHAEQEIEIHQPLKPDTNLTNSGKIVNVQDKGKMTLVQFETISKNEKNEKVFTNTMSLIIRGVGGSGYKGNPVKQLPKIPTTEPNKIVEQKTQPNQAIIYRLSGDTNPLHVDQSMAQLGGFEKPILHGLCFYGISAKIVAQQFLNGDQDQIKSVQARFVGSIYPGETLIYKLWQKQNQIIFSASTKERQKEVIQGVIQILDTQSPKL